MESLPCVRLVALDLDGTLLNEDFQLSERIIRAVAQAQARGLHLAVITGRDHLSAIDIVRQLGLADGWLVTSGGSVLWHAGQVAQTLAFSPEDARLILQKGAAYQTGFFIDFVVDSYSFGNPYYVDLYQHVSLAGPAPDEAALYAQPLIKASLIQERAVLEQIRVELAEQFPGIGLAYPFEHVLDINPPGANKGAALRALAAHLGVAMSETAAMGDSENDLAMLKAAGLSIAMSNAPAHVRAAADWIAPPNSEEGAAWALERLMKCQ